MMDTVAVRAPTLRMKKPDFSRADASAVYGRRFYLRLTEGKPQLRQMGNFFDLPAR